MYIEMTETLSSMIGAFRKGERYEVPDATGEIWIDRKLAVETPIPPEWISQIFARLDVGAGKTGLFLPFIGEVGWLVMWHVRMVHFSNAKRKIVCCRRGQECLFPSADEFFYDWVDPIDDAVRAGTDREVRMWPELAALFPDAVPVPAGGLSLEQELAPVKIETHIPIIPRTRRGLKVDVCIGVRQRKFLPEKNYPHWPMIAAELARRGITFAVIGSRESSYALEGMEYMSADFGDWDAAVELLQNCRLFIGTDSGGAHLASLVGACPMIVQTVPHPISGTTRCFIDRMKQTTQRYVAKIPATEWDNPKTMLALTLGTL